MEILAIWDRQKIAPKSCLTLVLTSDNQFLEISPDVKYIGKDKDNNSLFEDTGDYDIGHAFGEDIEFDFNRACYFAHHFGFELIKQFKNIEA